DNDGDGAVDWDGGPEGAAADPDCSGATDSWEGGSTCGLGFEVAPLLAALGVLRRRRRRRA
ncbi:MAG: hypothetical protein R3263_04580, partial [Myxococcota bacterium]|nr:hypothetical protein [Myxococcota bacterium]